MNTLSETDRRVVSTLTLLLFILSGAPSAPKAFAGPHSPFLRCVQTQVIVDTYFKPVQGNAPVDQAQVILIGNTHSNESHIQLAQTLVNSLAHDGDIVLLEGVSLGKTVNAGTFRQLKEIDPPIVGMGWDDLNLRKTAETNVRTLLKLHNEIEKEPDSKTRALLQQRFSRLARENETIAISQRNNSLIKTLKAVSAHRDTAQRIFVFGGSGHFKESKLLKYLSDSGEKYAVLVPADDTEPSIEDTQSYFNDSKNLKKIH